MNLFQWMADFHLLRPYGLLLLPFGGALLWLLSRSKRTQSAWSQVIPANLLRHLQTDNPSDRRTTLTGWLVLGWVIASLALSGPSWQRLPSVVYKNQAPLVIVLDLSWSMYASDLSPDRLTRAQRKIRDIMDIRIDGTTGLVAYAGDGYRVAPLTDDRATITNLLSVLEPSLMPLAGSRASRGIRMALELLGSNPGDGAQILLLTDEVSPEESDLIRQQLKGTGVMISIIGVGTPEGAPISVEGGGYLKDTNGAIVIPRLDAGALKGLARSLGGRYATISFNPSDWKQVQAGPSLGDSARQQEQTFDQWSDQGYWLLLPLLGLLLASFRRGWLLTLLLLPIVLMPSEPSYALDWQSLWKTPDQQGKVLLEEKRPQDAATKFDNPAWQGYSHFEAGNYEAASDAFKNSAGIDSLYNRANAEAMAGNLPQALTLYDEVIEQNPNYESALKNRSIVEKLMKQQQENTKNSDSPQQTPKESQEESEKGSQEHSSDPSGSDSGSDQNPQNQPFPNTSEGAKGAENTDQQQSKDRAADAGQEQASLPEANNNESTDSLERPESDQQHSKPEQPATSPGNANNTEEQKAQSSVDDLPLSEDRQAMEGWLRRIPDDPSGLLRRKFEMQHRQRDPLQAGEQIW
ncbi:vWA domain-containing protein [Aestuariirhabdus sp. LZHN29]|uniref:vWA domain-containing protein n=1 Tax=Aestuariirhabdus sp. LZHN29 TaxID=3417462 RepID=UPI003CEF7828